MALVGQAIAGHNLYNEEALAHQESQISFWRSNSLIIAMSLIVGSFAILAVYLRQRGSPE